MQHAHPTLLLPHPAAWGMPAGRLRPAPHARLTCEPMTRASTALPNSREKKSSSSEVPQYCGRSPTNRVAPSSALQQEGRGLCLGGARRG